MDSTLHDSIDRKPSGIANLGEHWDSKVDAYFSADVETDGPIPGPFSILSFAFVYAGTFDGKKFNPPSRYDAIFYRELKPISESFDSDALRVNGLDRARLCLEGYDPSTAMAEAHG